MGHPLLADDTYGGGGPAALSAVAKGGARSVEEVRASRQSSGRAAAACQSLQVHG